MTFVLKSELDPSRREIWNDFVCDVLQCPLFETVYAFVSVLSVGEKTRRYGDCASVYARRECAGYEVSTRYIWAFTRRGCVKNTTHSIIATLSVTFLCEGKTHSHCTAEYLDIVLFVCRTEKISAKVSREEKVAAEYWRNDDVLQAASHLTEPPNTSCTNPDCVSLSTKVLGCTVGYTRPVGTVCNGSRIGEDAT